MTLMYMKGMEVALRGMLYTQTYSSIYIFLCISRNSFSLYVFHRYSSESYLQV